MTTVGVVATLCFTVMLTTGRNIAESDAVLANIDHVGTRILLVRAEAASGLDTRVLDRLAPLHGVEWIGALGPASDVTNAAIEGGTRVALRPAYGTGWPIMGIGGPGVVPPGSRRAVTTVDARRLLGLRDGVGVVRDVQSDENVDVIGSVPLPEYLDFVGPAVLVPEPSIADPRPVSVLIVIASTAAQVEALTSTVSSLLAVDDATKVTVTSGEQLAQLRERVGSQLGVFGHAFVLVVFLVGAALVAMILSGLVLMRRRDFGRRRALGASRRLVIGLLLATVGLQAMAGSIVGSVVALALLVMQGSPVPSPAFCTAVVVLALVTSLGAAVIPALIASTREPLRELRVP
ncbi:lipoprotein ABC transporter permease [Subtercola sp. PAMC28395]|uniref:FtsX-like permease family protein n=1 Tax=Subtercola sp. PAMC28395 TaxID=2846775 RepID=UPI001C0DB5CE|nr:FtsX-like permease family protein [Subtercola sp. PAMC28395]QWT23148.1 lipoprotein ABC transporter permease [Subtercola sp. PAMC28395]